MARKRVVVHGEVQGVGFRWGALHEAKRLGVSGFARNLPDGSVEVEIEGKEPRLGSMLDWLASGPPAAIVTSIEVSDIEDNGKTGFEIDF